MNGSDHESLEQAAGRLTGSDVSLERLPGGANNRVFAVLRAPEPCVLKAYVRDGRDRLGAEWKFSEYAWNCGLRCLPQPLAHDPDLGVAVYRKAEGRRLRRDELRADHVRQAAEFAHALQADPAAAGGLPVGAEGCFTVRAHLELIEGRVRRLTAVADGDVRALLDTQMRPAWDRIAGGVADSGVELDAEVEHCVSPSDFGFHNAFVDGDGRVTFFDFEYAGWDDPAKLLCDFFCQPEVPVARERFAQLAGGPFAPAAERAELLLDAYRIKWCCIMLNDFLPSGDRRREFALGGADRDRRRRAQLDKVRSDLSSLAATPG